MGIKQQIKAAIKKLVYRAGYEFIPANSRGLAYLSAEETVEEANKKNLTVPQYLETIWGLQTVANNVIASFELPKYLKNRPLSVLEIGAGTGVYTDQVYKTFSKNDISSYQVYETSKGWCDYLTETYRVEAALTNGYQLNSTLDHSVDFIHAHGVFVYTAFITTISYLQEICRTARLNSIVAFDAFDESCFSPDVITHCINDKKTYFSIMPEKFILGTFRDNGFELVKTFYADWGTGKPKYFVFRRNRI